MLLVCRLAIMSFYSISRCKREVRLLICEKFNNSVLSIDSKAATLAIVNQNMDTSTAVFECRTLYSKLKFKSKTVTLQWIPGHCGNKDNENANSLAKKGLNIKQTHIRHTSFHSAKTHVHILTINSAHNQNEELNSLYRSPNLVRVIKSRRLRWAGHVAE